MQWSRSGTAPNASHKSLGQRTLLLCTWLVVVVGITASVVGAVMWKADLEHRRQQQFEPVATDVAETVASALARDSDLTAIARSMVALNPTITNSDMGRWYATIDGEHRYPESLGFQYIQRVDAADLPEFAATALRDPIPFSPVFSVASISPAGARSQYCMSRFEVLRADSSDLTRAGAGVMAVIDWCATALAERLDHVATTGESVEIGLPELVHSIGPLVADALHLDPALVEQNTADFLGKTARSVFLFTPVYRDGVMPPTAELRSQQLLGWIGGIFDIGQILDDAVTSHPGFAVSIAPKDDPTGALATVASTNSNSVSAPLAHNIEIAHNGAWTVTVVGDLPAGGRSPATEALGILGGGTVVTLLVFALLRTMGTARASALALVDAKTGELEYQALHDPLTGLANRALVIDRADQMLARARRDERAVAVVFIDLDDFKDVNDTAGRGAGDEVLIGVAGRIKTLTSETDTVGRVGGDEFVVVTECANDDAGPALAARILAALHTPFASSLSGSEYTVTASIGVASDRGLDGTELLHAADLALYEAKAGGQNRFVVFDSRMRDDVHDRITLDAELRQALDAGQFRLAYQPTFDLERVTVNGVEALLRWQHPTRGLLAPGAFLSSLERNGLIVPVGRWVLKEACRQGAQWHAAGHPLVIAANISAYQLSSGTLISDVAEALELSGLDPSHLVIEITESVLMTDATSTIEQLRGLKRLGVRIAIDDFGTGYSSLAYLRQFPIDILKVDQSFVAAMMQSREAAAVVRTVIQLAQALGLETVAEGIEHVDQLHRLRAEGCDTGQGYLISKPLPARDVVRFVERLDRRHAADVRESAGALPRSPAA